MMEQNCNNLDNIALDSDEEIQFASENAVLTNRRVFVPDRRSRKAHLTSGLIEWLEVPISESMSPKLKNGGKSSKKALGVRCSLSGIALLLIQIVPFSLFDWNVIRELGTTFESIYFLVSMLALTAGLYFLLGSYINPRPHTSVLFTIPGGQRDLVTTFPGWDNAEASELGRIFRRMKRTV